MRVRHIVRAVPLDARSLRRYSARLCAADGSGGGNPVDPYVVVFLGRDREGEKEGERPFCASARWNEPAASRGGADTAANSLRCARRAVMGGVGGGEIERD